MIKLRDGYLNQAGITRLRIDRHDEGGSFIPAGRKVTWRLLAERVDSSIVTVDVFSSEEAAWKLADEIASHWEEAPGSPIGRAGWGISGTLGPECPHCGSTAHADCSPPPAGQG